MLPDLFTRRAALEPTSIDDAARTVDVVWSTGAGVKRRDAAGQYEERLSLDPQHVDVASLIGAPVLDGHRQDSVEQILGVVTAASVDGKVGRATLKLSERAEAIWKDIKAGILRAVSVGYQVAQWQDGKANGTRTRTAVRWTPREISLVAIPADTGATVRGDPSMKKKQQQNPDVDPDVSDDQDDLETRAETNLEIRKLVKAAGLDHIMADTLIDRNATVDEAKAALFDQLATRSATTIQHQRIDVGANHDAPEEKLTRMADALEARMTGRAPTDAGREYMTRRVHELAGELLELRGVRGVRMMSPDTLITRAMHTTSDFPQLLTSTGNRVLLAAFQAAPNPLKSLARTSTVSDFRTKTTLKLSEFPRLSLVNEAGEVTSGTRGEAKEAYALKTYARIFSLSRNALVNDDLGAFSDFSMAAGRAAAETEADVLTALLTANSGTGPTLDDGNVLFHSTHGNVAGSGTVIDVAAIAAARLAMRSQKGLDALTPINAVPKFLLVSPTKETQAEQALAPLAPATVATTNPFTNTLTILVEPRLSGNRWYVFADPVSQPVLEYAYLSSAQGPQMASREGWDVLGMEFRVVLDFGAGVVDHRGAYMNAGA